MERIIFHVDVNSAFLSWESTYRKKVLGEEIDLREIASAIGGEIEERKGVILAKSILAKKYGIITGEPIVSALRKCPNLIVVKPNFKVYTKYSIALMDLLKEYSPIVEQYSIDEAYVDMTGTEGLHGNLVELAYTIKERIHKELGFTVNIGISNNKLLAKMAGELEKPNLVHTLFPAEIKDKMWPLPVGELFFVGKASEKTLRLLGIKTIGELAKADVKLLRLHLKKQGEIIHQYANGIDASLVKQEHEAHKGYGNSMTIPFDISSLENAYLVLLSLCETVGSRLRDAQVEASCLSVSMVDTYFERKSHQIILQNPTAVTKELYEYACRVFKEMWDYKTPIRQLGVHTTKLENNSVYQLNLFETPKTQKSKKLDQAIDVIRNRYGDDAVMRASFVGSKLEHMAGGISKEKKTSISQGKL